MTMEGENKMSKTTPFVLAWGFLTLAWSIFTPPHKTFAARLLLFQPAWILRAIQRDSTCVSDLALFEIVHTIYSYAAGAWRFSLADLRSRWPDTTDPTTVLCLQIAALLALCSIFAGSIVYRGSQLKQKQASSDEPLHAQTIDEQVLPPLLLTSKTTHSRMFPRKHSFAYSYLLVGVPVGIHGCISNVLSVDSESRGWFAVESGDYLNSSSSRISLAEKLKRYLHTQQITDREYAFAYLVTAPRFLGYSFNPVSFWYLYDADTRLKYMILEVNNTFGERRMYLLRGENAKVDSGTDTDTTEEQDHDAPNRLIFSETWLKDFHVSPFNSRKGSYSLKAVDPLAAFQETGRVRIDNTIVLRSSKDHAKLVARVWSEGEARDPSQISTIQTAMFIARWSWVGFATFPRIAWEAAKLSFKRRLHVWYRPEVATTSLGRAYTEDEQELEAFFQAFFTQAISEAHKPLRVVYERAHGQDTKAVLYSPGYTYEEDHKRTLTIKVLSPAFYSRFVHYAHVKEAFDRECLSTEDKNRTAHIEHADLLPILLDAIKQQVEIADNSHSRLSLIEQIRWACLRRLRCPPAAAAYLETTATTHNATDIRTFGYSELDRFVMRFSEDAAIYRRISTKAFLAERIAFGLPALIELMDLIVRAALLWVAIAYSERFSVADVLRPRTLTSHDVAGVVIAIGLANLVHLWSAVKG